MGYLGAMSKLHRLFAMVTVMGCGGQDFPTPPPLSPRDGLGSYWVSRSDAELAHALRTACESAVAQSKPVLIWYSASWCGDCRRHYAHERAGHIDDALSHWERVVIDPGRFDRHTALLEAHGVVGIPTLVATQPIDCTAAATTWPVLDQGRFDRPLLDSDPGRLIDWLERTRS